MNLKEIGVNTRNCVDSAQDGGLLIALEITTFNFRVTYAMELVSHRNQVYLCTLRDRNSKERKYIKYSFRSTAWLSDNVVAF